MLSKATGPGQAFSPRGGARDWINILKSYWPGAGVFPERGRPGTKKVWLNGRTGAGVFPERGRPVRDQGGIKAGPKEPTISQLLGECWRLIRMILQ